MSDAAVKKKRDIEPRLVSFAVRTIKLIDSLPSTRCANHIGGQLIRSATSPAPNYCEAQSAESRRDFIHKLKIALKELRESLVWLKIIKETQLVKATRLNGLIDECDQLIAILVASVNKVRIRKVEDRSNSNSR